MPSVKCAGKPFHQLLFSEAVSQHCPMATLQGSSAARPTTCPPCLQQDPIMERILQKITAVGSHLESVDSKIYDLTDEIKSICADIPGFQDQVEGMKQWRTAVEVCLRNLLGQDKELLYLRNKLTDLEDRSCRYNVYFFGFPECAKGVDMRDFLSSLLPTLTGLTVTHP
ncbi:hypothetical protein NDU88_006182 [Pleurodeles waltl]|uniref:Uncharacterized protein n=1 Tax=Pleurodeles waltl TaxID=8319 RepID=A0AAV7X3H6_PLEWA|nr:hypothetical protein NDU88_006182 [Pleurodeles waltl]